MKNQLLAFFEITILLAIEFNFAQLNSARAQSTENQTPGTGVYQPVQQECGAMLGGIGTGSRVMARWLYS